MSLFDHNHRSSRLSVRLLGVLIVRVLLDLDTPQQLCDNEVVNDWGVSITEIDDRHLAGRRQRLVIEGLRFLIVEDV